MSGTSEGTKARRTPQRRRRNRAKRNPRPQTPAVERGVTKSEPTTWWQRLLARITGKREIGEDRLERLGQVIGYRFRDRELLEQALTHRSSLSGTRRSRLVSNERLELLGDAVLGLAVTEFLFKRFPRKPEGELTNMKSVVVSRRILSRVARDLRLGEYILMSPAEERSGGRQRPSILADTLEALVGAIYLDAGFGEAMRFVRRFVLAQMNEFLSEELYRNYKSELLEYAQARGWGNPIYTVLKEEGPDHDKTFTIQVSVAEKASGVGKGPTKKRAEQLAAREALKQLGVVRN